LYQLFEVLHDITKRKRMDDLIRTQRDLGLALSNASRLEETLQLCLDAAIHVSGMDCGGIYLVDKASGTIDLALHKGLSSDFIDKASHYDSDSERARLIMTGKPIYTQYRKLGMSLDEIKKLETIATQIGSAIARITAEAQIE